MKNLLKEIKEAKKEAKNETLKYAKCAFGQGWAIIHRDNSGREEELASFESDEPITLKAIKEVTDSYRTLTAKEVWIEGRFVGASSLYDYINNEDYIDNVNYWEVDLPKGEK